MEDFMKAKYGVVNTMKGIYDPKTGGLVNVSKIIEEIKEKEEKAKQERRERSPVQAKKEPEVKLSFFDKLRQKKAAEAARLISESQSKIEIPTLNSDESSLMELSLILPKKKPIPPLYSAEQKLFFAKL
jgi:hypothetical protein